MSQYSSLFVDESSDEDDPLPSSKLTYRILLVDDEVNVQKALIRAFRQENYEIVTASNGEEALKVLAETPCQLMITDYMMPQMNGAQLLRKVKELYPDIIRIMLTGQADTDAVMAAIHDGAVYKFILKPWNDDDLRITVSLALEQYDLKQENEKLKQSNQRNEQEINMLSKLAVTHRSQLAIMLNKRNLLTDQQLQKLYKEQQTKKKSTLKIILEQGWLSEDKIRRILVKDFMFEEVSLQEFSINSAIAALIAPSICRQQFVVPLKQEGRRLLLAMADPMDEGIQEELKFTTGLDIKPVLASSKDIGKKLDELFGADRVSFKDLEEVIGQEEPLDQIEVVIDEEDDISIEDLLHGTNEPPAIRLVNAIIMEAIRLNASDIHIQPRTANVIARFRIDGVLQDKLNIPSGLHLSLVSRVKVMAELDITERRRPQDGRITVKTPMRIVDLRISSLPTINGEKIVMRLLDRNSTVHSLSALGFSGPELQKLSNVISKPQGIVLATGPTGSGKTTTLYSMLQHTATSEKNYITVEDPVEYYMDMAGQVMIKEKHGLNFAAVLRAILRQDPDVILLGEIRDQETAEVAFRAASTGHQVFSTLHTNSTLDTVSRLFDLGLKPYTIASAVEAIIAQRLARKICKHCSVEITPTETLLCQLGPLFKDSSTRFYEGTGCDHCNGSGFSGRAAIYEVLVPSDMMRHGISENVSILKLKELAKKEGLKSLYEEAKEKVCTGVIPPSEVIRVLGPF